MQAPKNRKYFADIRLGQPLPAEDLPWEQGAWDELAQGLVARWSGSDRVSLIHIETHSPAASPRRLSAHIFARHLDSSRSVDIAVLGWDRERVCARAFVRAALA